MCRGAPTCVGTVQNPCCLAFFNLQVNIQHQRKKNYSYCSNSSSGFSSESDSDEDGMGNTQSSDIPANPYTLDSGVEEPVIIREVKPANVNEKRSVPKIPVLFKWQETVLDKAKGVFLSGSFNNWDKIPMKLSDNEYLESIELPPGKYEYKFFVDGEWKHDEKLSHTANQFGSYNNIIVVSVSDTSLCISCKDGRATNLNIEELGGEQDKYSDDGFSSTVPDIEMYHNAGPPPQLPVQLSRGILNSETDQSTDPTLLPEPQHVLLNHLYALTVKDGVMVLGATHRYKRKYVTTMLYKPITKTHY